MSGKTSRVLKVCADEIEYKCVYYMVKARRIMQLLTPEYDHCQPAETGYFITRTDIEIAKMIQREEAIQMPIKKVSGGYKWGSKGKVYKSRAGAEKQARAAYASGYQENEKKK